MNIEKNRNNNSFHDLCLIWVRLVYFDSNIGNIIFKQNLMEIKFECLVNNFAYRYPIMMGTTIIMTGDKTE